MILTRALISYEIAARYQKDGGFRDSYAWHKRIWDAFPGKPAADRDFLTRLDDTGEDFRLLIQSLEPPVCPDWCPADAFHTKEIPESFFQHPGYRFSLLANPTIKKVIRDAAGNRKKNGRREPIVTREELIAWLTRKATQHGFEIEPSTLQTIPRPRQLFTKKEKATETLHHGTHTATEFTGTLKVTDPALFQQSVRTGIGSAKAFGFGMLCLSPV